MLQYLKSFRDSFNPVQLIVELAIVFIGVYLAFLLSNHQESANLAEARQRALALSNIGIERYEKLFSEFVAGHETNNLAFRKSLEQGEIPYFGDVTFPAPQYPIDVIKFIMTGENYELFEIGLYIPLTGYVNGMERLMYVEEKLVELSEAYRPLPPTSHPEYDYLYAIEFQKAQRYLKYLEIRKRTCMELVERSKELATLIGE